MIQIQIVEKIVLPYFYKRNFSFGHLRYEYIHRAV